MNYLRKKLEVLINSTKMGRLPSEYQEVEWVANNSDRNAIKTGVNTIDLTVKIGVIPLTGGISNMLFGTTYGAHAMMVLLNSNYTATFWGNNNSISSLIQNQENHLVLTNTSQIVNGIEYSYINNGSNQEWCIGGAPAQQYYSNSKFTYCKLYKNGELVRDFIPCYHKTSGVVGMYDCVTQEFYEPMKQSWSKGGDVS